ncbi:DUF5984 family protein [Streptomyces sp. NPDC049040]|uniref:DUF5984 family protein n=1 Tax=Streptomyces sp. NPDC049040 TaxID=3365593 RepID=UPI003719218C
MIDTVPAIRFRFGLTPLDQVEPWGREQRSLHWFGLTDGWYCVDLGGHEVLRYSERTVRELGSDRDGGRPHPYVAYYVARLWEDVVALTSEALEPVPQDLVDIAAETSPDWTWLEVPEAEPALSWHSAGFLYTDYLRVAPHIRCWRTVAGGDDTVTLSWQHQPDPEGVISFAGPQAGRVAMPTGEFVAAVTELDRALLAAMDRRIGELEAAGPMPGVEVDMERLRREHRDRATWLQRARDHERNTDWGVVRAGARMMLAPAQDAAADGGPTPG